MKVYVEDDSPLLNNGLGYTFPFAFDKRWTFTAIPEEADIVPLLHQYREVAKKQYDYFLKKFNADTPVVLIGLLFHDEEEKYENGIQDSLKVYLERYNNITILSTAYNTPYNNVKFYDFLWNRTKGLYGFDYLNIEKAENSPWLWNYSLDIFSLEQGEKNIRYNILCPNKAYYGKEEEGPRLEYRAALHELVRQNKWGNVLISDPDNGNIFYTDNWQEKYRNTIQKGGTYAPIANRYYAESLVSAYVESVTIGHPNLVRTITEKTWEPLLKGHFILPFASPGIVQELKSRGFKFPNFINYEYASVTDDKKRWNGFLVEFQKIQKLSVDQLKNLYNDNIHVLQHNRKLFETIPYDDLYDKIKHVKGRQNC